MLLDQTRLQKTLNLKKSLVIMILEFRNGLIVKISANGVAEHQHFHEIKIFQKNETIINM